MTKKTTPSKPNALRIHKGAGVDVEKMVSYGTDKQAEIYRLYHAKGTYTATAKLLGIDHTSVRRAVQAIEVKAAKDGYSPDHDNVRIVPPGFTLKGTSTFYDRDGNPAGQWVKTAVDRDAQMKLLEKAVEAFAEDLPRLAPIPAPLAVNGDLMAVYPIGDAHIGMLAWAEETGESYDLRIAEDLHVKAMQRLVEQAPSCAEAVLVNLGDFLHADNMEGTTTRSGHVLDMDSRYAKMARTAVRILRTMIDTALTKHTRVRVINAVGNHDDTGALMLSICLANVYEGDPRVIVDTSPTPAHYVRWGKTLLGVHHGHSIKAERLPGVMAADRAKEWGETEHRYWLCGHVHHASMKDHPGVQIETFQTLAAKDAYATWGGYRAGRSMSVIMYHAKHGEVGRVKVTPEMLLSDN